MTTDQQDTSRVQILFGEALQGVVIEIVDRAEEYVVLVCPFVEQWPDLADAIARARKRGVDTLLLTESPHRKRKDSLREFVDAAGMRARQVESVHAKVYLNERVALVTSFNLLLREGPATDVGALVDDPGAHGDLLDWAEALETGSTEIQYDGARRWGGGGGGRDRDRDRDRGSRGGRSNDGPAYCIGCGNEDDRVERARPLCSQCFEDSDRGYELRDLPNRSCLACGEPYDSSHDRPLCSSCHRGSRR